MCLNKGCQAAANAYGALDNCRYTNCRDACFTTTSDGTVVGLKVNDSACTSCVDTSCATERDACPTATCP